MFAQLGDNRLEGGYRVFGTRDGTADDELRGTRLDCRGRGRDALLVTDGRSRRTNARRDDEGLGT